jgi:hypothetical protein
MLAYTIGTGIRTPLTGEMQPGKKDLQIFLIGAAEKAPCLTL